MRWNSTGPRRHFSARRNSWRSRGTCCAEWPPPGRPSGFWPDAADRGANRGGAAGSWKPGVASGHLWQNPIGLRSKWRRPRRATARAAGYRCLEADFNQSGQGLSSTNAPALLQRLSSHRGDVTLWLGDHTSAAGLAGVLAAAEDADGSALHGRRQPEYLQKIQHPQGLSRYNTTINIQYWEGTPWAVIFWW